MANKIVNDPRWSAINRDGTPAVGATLSVLLSGTDIKVPIYSDYEGLTPATNPLVSDERGYFPVFYTDNSQRVKIKIESSNGTLISQVNDLTI